MEISTNPIELTSEWREIELANPIGLAPRYYLSLLYGGQINLDDFSKPKLPTGELLSIHAELLDAERRPVALKCESYEFGLRGGTGIACVPESKANYSDRKFRILRIRSEPNITIMRVTWTRSMV